MHDRREHHMTSQLTPTRLAPDQTQKPVITVDHLTCRSNQRDTLFFYSPFGTYVMTDHDDAPSTLRLVPAVVDKDSWHCGADLRTAGNDLGEHADVRAA